MKEKEVIFITGSTGLLGNYLLKGLLSKRSSKIERIIALSRGRTQKEARERVERLLLKIYPDLRNKPDILSLLEVVSGDITRENLGLSNETYKKLVKSITLIYHSAAMCEFKIPLSFIREANVKGTKNVLELALTAKRGGRFKQVHHISTVAVAGDRKGIFYEKNLDLGQGFNNTYEQSKFEAEKLVVEYRNKGLAISIYRPAIITGDCKTGYTNNFKMLYQPLHLFNFELFKEIPADKNTRYSFCPVDYVAEAIIRISFDRNLNDNSTYHIVNPNTVTFGFFLNEAANYFKFRKPKFIPKEEFCLEKFSPAQFGLIEPYAPYFNYKLRFDSSAAKRILRPTNFKWPKPNKIFFKRLFKFCIQSGFIKPKKSPY